MSKLSPQHKWIICILIVVVVNAGIWFLGVEPTSKQITETKQQLAAQEELETELTKRLTELQAIDTVALHQELEEFDILIPDKGLLREVMTELEAKAAEMKLTLASMSISAPGEEAGYQNLRFTLGVSGSYFNLFAYIAFLEDNPRLVLVNSFNLSSSDEGIASNIQLTIFASDFDTYTPHEAPGRENPFVVD